MASPFAWACGAGVAPYSGGFLVATVSSATLPLEAGRDTERAMSQESVKAT